MVETPIGDAIEAGKSFGLALVAVHVLQLGLVDAADDVAPHVFPSDLLPEHRHFFLVLLETYVDAVHQDVSVRGRHLADV